MEEQSCKRILIVNVNWLGDVLFSTPFIRAVRKNFTNAYIACMAVPRCREVLEGNPYLDKIIIYDAGANGVWGNINFVKQLKAYDFDTVFLLHRSFTRAFLARLAGINNRIGYYTFKRGFLLTQKPKPPKINSLHRAKFYLGLLEAVGLETDNKGCDFFISEKDSSWADNFFKDKGKMPGQMPVVFNPGGNWLPKRWPMRNFIELGKLFLSKFRDNVKIIITGASKDAELAGEINKALGNSAIISCGIVNLKQTAAIFKKSSLVISSDSGPLHIAVSVGANVIGIFGPTSPFITGPYNADEKKVVVIHKNTGCKIPCYKADCSDYKCMKAITPEEVFEAALRLMANRSIL